MLLVNILLDLNCSTSSLTCVNISIQHLACQFVYGVILNLSCHAHYLVLLWSSNADVVMSRVSPDVYRNTTVPVIMLLCSPILCHHAQLVMLKISFIYDVH